MVQWILCFIFFMNIVAYIVYAVDKKRARSYQWRVSESRLLWIALLGGGIGAWRAMKDFHHKTQKNKFRFWIPIFNILQFGLLIYYLTRITWNVLIVKSLGVFIGLHLVLFYVLFAIFKQPRYRYNVEFPRK